MAISPIPFFAVNMASAVSSDLYYDAPVTLQGGAAYNSGGLLCNTSGARAYWDLASTPLPSAWPMWLHIRFALDSSSPAQNIAGIMRGSAGSADRGTAYLEYAAGTTATLATRRNNTGATAVLNGTARTYTRGASSGDYSVISDVFVLFKSVNSTVQIDAGSPAADGSGTSTAPLYSSPRFYLGNMTWSVGSPDSKWICAGMWEGDVLSGADITDIIADPVAAYLTPPPKYRPYFSGE